MLKKGLRLRKNRDFTYIYRKGQKARGRFIAVYALKGSREMLTGVSLSRKTGNAVTRNLYKRRILHIWRELLPGLRTSKYVIVAGPEIRKASFQDLKTDLERTARVFMKAPKGEQ